MKISKLLLLVSVSFSAHLYANTLPDFANNRDERALSNPSYILGQYWFRKLSGSAGLIEFPPAYNYLQQAISEIVPNTNLYNKTIDLGLLNSSQTNAFVIPGNHMFIYSDIMRIISDEASFLGLLGHEIAHLELNHYERSLEAQRNEQNKTLMMLLAGIAAASAGGGGEATSALWLGGIANQQENFLSHSRAQEQEADRRGRELLENSGLPTYGMNELLSALQKQSMGSNRIEFLSTHPLPQTRVSDALTAKQRGSIIFEPSSTEFMYFRATMIAYRAAIDNAQYRAVIDRYISDSNQQTYAYALAEVLLQHQNEAARTIKEIKTSNQFIDYLKGLIELTQNDIDSLKETVQNRLLLSPSDATFQYLMSQAGIADNYLRENSNSLGYEKRMIYRNNIAVARAKNDMTYALYFQGLLNFSRGQELAGLNLINRSLKTANETQKQEISRKKQQLEQLMDAQKEQDIQ